MNVEEMDKSKVAMVYGQMNEPPGNRLRVALTGLTMAERFRERAATYYCLWTTSIAIRWREPKSLRCLGVCLRRWDISRRWPKKWVFAGTHYLYQDRIDYLDSGGLCAGG